MARPVSIAQKKRAVGLTLSPYVAQLLIVQASEKGISVSAYIERIVLERDWQKQQALETKK